MADVVVLYSGPLVSLREAKSLGSNRLFTGKPCVHGHVDQWRVSDSKCMECVRSQRKRWRVENEGKFRTSERRRQRAWRKNNPGLAAKRDERRKIANAIRAAATAPDRERKKREKMAETARRNEERKNDPEWRRKDVARCLARRNERMEKIAGRLKPIVCDICDGSHHRGIVFDHCHDTGVFRGWICDRCNVVLGFVKDDPDLLRKIASYIEKFDGKANGRTEKPIAGFSVRGTGSVLSY